MCSYGLEVVHLRREVVEQASRGSMVFCGGPSTDLWVTTQINGWTETVPKRSSVASRVMPGVWFLSVVSR